MTSLRILDVGGTITDFEHYRIDVALAVPGPTVGAVQEPATWAMLMIGFAFMGWKKGWFKGFKGNGQALSAA